MSENFTVETMNRAFGEIFRQTDRAAAIVSGSTLEELLERVIKAFLMEHKDENAKFSTTGFDFNLKIKLAYNLGLINQSEFKDLMYIRKIRNEFAHTFEEINFDTPRIKDWILYLNTLKDTNPTKEIMDNLKDIKIYFKTNVTLLGSMLFLKREKVKRLSLYKYE